ncbi:hypothetical protein DNH61_18305 [Paenibacillus sambharensis]|uniref:Cthe-2314-like HEPN domain-containing protein n=1 Tax=Paenibacillus sambharensis TaxID=1803190 RepID=A0A2W1L889_9BACL|nr:Cthe_2314 family HEPN domain-containing protein [Paenibacillus sambharensis]PZD94360.1 hypothetical protein DNH61_18305 [Paenibacillus sambharensis]
MLRFLFNENPRGREGKLGETLRQMEQFATAVGSRAAAGKDGDHRLRTQEIWSKGLMASLNELEQSRYAAKRYAERITKNSLSEMSDEELFNYYRHVYFDKNAFIRVFAVLDKLGTLMNDVFGLKTEKMKTHFSYFTVLRGMRENRHHPALAMALGEVKDRHRDAMSRLRKRRNTEIHYMNSELTDDLLQSHKAYGKAAALENIRTQMADLDEAFEFVTETLLLVFRYACQRMS